MASSVDYVHKNCCLCDKHFEDSQFMNSSRKRLVWNAVPSLFDVANPPQSVDVKRKLPSQHPTDVKRSCSRAASAAATPAKHTYGAELPTSADRESKVETEERSVLAKVL